jgi:hypothetical protein
MLKMYAAATPLVMVNRCPAELVSQTEGEMATEIVEIASLEEAPTIVLQDHFRN